MANEKAKISAKFSPFEKMCKSMHTRAYEEMTEENLRCEISNLVRFSL
jgi:roadblock/LC7 domain-containing protein